MKRIRVVVFICISSLIINTGCKKDSVDFRDKYCGEWNFKTDYYYFTMSDSYFDTIYNYQGSIWYDTLGRINIEFRDNIVLESIITDNGEIIDNYLYDNDEFSGEFINEKNLKIELKTHGDGFMISQFINGTRQ